MYKRLSAPLVLFLGAAYLYFIQLPNIRVMSKGSHSLLLPKILLVLLMVLSGLEMIKTILANKDQLAVDLAFDSTNQNLLFSFLLAAGYLYGMTIVGYFLLTPIFLAAFIKLLGNQRWWLTGVFSLGITVVVYMIFIKLLYIPLPKGIGVFKVINEFIIY